MVFPVLLGSTLLRTPRTRLPQIFCRHRSLTQSIERGRQDRSEYSSRLREIRLPPDDGGAGRGKTRAELRFERFGPGDTPKRTGDARPPRDRNERGTSRPSSRFGRVGPPRPRSDAPSRFGDVAQDKPFRGREDRPQPREDRPARDRDARPPRRDDRFGRSSDRSAGGGSRFSNDREDKSPYRERFGERNERPQGGRFGDRSERPQGRHFGERSGERSEQPQEGRSFDSRDRFGSRTPRPWEARGAKPVERNTGFGDRAAGDIYRDGQPRYVAREGRSERPEMSDRPDRSERPELPERSFQRQDGPPSRQWERPGRSQLRLRRPYERPTSYSDAPLGAAAHAEGSGSLARDFELLPYSTAASEFIYGYSSVLAALKANRRKLYKLYIHSRGASRDGLLAKIRALKMFPITEEVGDEYLRAMDKASSGRPHNGVVLESSPLPVPPITELRTPSKEDESFSVVMDSQSAEDALVNGKQELYSYKSAGWRHPLILFLDGVVSYPGS